MSRVAAVVALAALSSFSRARANGAFPDSMGILLPADQPNRILASTNFGLLVSEDDGASWSWICEEAVGINSFLYQQGGPPNDLIVALSVNGLSYSGDFGCTWNRPGGSISTLFVDDAFPDAVNPGNVYALVRSSFTGTAVSVLQQSLDGAQTFGAPLLTSSGSQHFSGVENARSSPQTIYVTLYDLPPSPAHPYIVRSYDGGRTWRQPFFDPGPAFNARTIRLIAVDPGNASRVYLRLTDVTNGTESLGIYDDGAGTLRDAYRMPSVMSAFLRRSDGAIIVASRDGSAFISTDNGATFAVWPNAPHLRALGERNGVLYAVADNFVDGFAVARSGDQGATWQPLVRFEQLTGPKSCGDLANICAAPWQRLQNTLGLSPPDAGSPTPRHGCGQGPAAEGVSSLATVILVMVAIGSLAVRRRGR